MNQQNSGGKPPQLSLLHQAHGKGPGAQPPAPAKAGPASPALVAASLVSPAAPLIRFPLQEQHLLLEFARQALVHATAHTSPPQVSPLDLSPRLTEKRACFVTLMKADGLRGCVGQILAQEPLYLAVLHNARNAALHDTRFPQVEPPEVEQIRIEISVLTEPQPLSFSSPDELLSQLQPHRDGVLFRLGGRLATFLPKVWEQIPDKVAFLNHLAQKAGCRPSAWRDKEATLSLYQVESFAETAPPPP